MPMCCIAKCTTENALSRMQFISAVIDDLAADWLSTKGPYNVGPACDAPIRKPGLEKLPDKKERRCTYAAVKIMQVTKENALEVCELQGWSPPSMPCQTYLLVGTVVQTFL